MKKLITVMISMVFVLNIAAVSPVWAGGDKNQHEIGAPGAPGPGDDAQDHQSH